MERYDRNVMEIKHNNYNMKNEFEKPISLSKVFLIIGIAFLFIGWFVNYIVEPSYIEPKNKIHIKNKFYVDEVEDEDDYVEDEDDYVDDEDDYVDDKDKDINPKNNVKKTDKTKTETTKTTIKTTYQLTNNKNKKYCMGLMDDLDKNGQKTIAMRDCKNIELTNIMPKYDSHKLIIDNLCVSATGTENGSEINREKCEMDTKKWNIQWIFDENNIRLLNHPTKCLTVKDEPIVEGSKMQLWDCNNSEEAMKWTANETKTITGQYNQSHEIIEQFGYSLDIKRVLKQ